MVIIFRIRSTFPVFHTDLQDFRKLIRGRFEVRAKKNTIWSCAVDVAVEMSVKICIVEDFAFITDGEQLIIWEWNI